MEKICFGFLVLIWFFSVHVFPFPTAYLSTKSKVKDNVLQKEKLIAPSEPRKDHYENKNDNPETPVTMGNLGLRLFPEYFFNSKQTQKPLTDRFFPDSKKKDNTIPANDKKGKDKKDDYYEDEDEKKKKEKIGGIIPRVFTEKTVSVPKVKTDYLGNWVYNPWGVTYGLMFRDTRFMGVNYAGNPPLMDWHKKVHDPEKVATPTVCRYKSTIYHNPNPKRYLSRPNYLFKTTSVPILWELRKEIYKKGNSEECHVPEQTNWRTFVECMMMRNMRMESLLPFYPMRQIPNASEDYTIEHNQYWWPDDRNPEYFYLSTSYPFSYPEIKEFTLNFDWTTYDYVNNEP